MWTGYNSDRVLVVMGHDTARQTSTIYQVKAEIKEGGMVKRQNPQIRI